MRAILDEIDEAFSGYMNHGGGQPQMLIIDRGRYESLQKALTEIKRLLGDRRPSPIAIGVPRLVKYMGMSVIRIPGDICEVISC